MSTGSRDTVPASASPQRPLRGSAEPARDPVRDVEAPVAERSLVAEQPDQPVEPGPEAVDTRGVTQTVHSKPAELDSLFDHAAAADFRSRWDVVQRGFVDDPRQAVQAGDQLVTQVIQVLSASFAEQREQWEKDGDTDEPSTENLRLALRRYRSFFERLLAV